MELMHDTKIERSFSIPFRGILFFSVTLAALFFAATAAKYHDRALMAEAEMALVSEKVRAIESRVHQIDAYGDAIDSLMMTTIDRGESRDIESRLQNITNTMTGLKQFNSKVEEQQNLNNRLEDMYASSERLERTMKSLVAILSLRKDVIAAVPSITPVSGWVSSDYGFRSSPFSGKQVLHRGIDIGAEEGTRIYAPAAGKVTYAGVSKSFGKFLIIEHPYNVVTKYAHNSRLNVRRGQTVKRGQLIAEVGSTGRSTGPHLHYEVWVNDQAVDPRDFLLDRKLYELDLKNYSAANVGGEEILVSTADESYVKVAALSSSTKRSRQGMPFGAAPLLGVIFLAVVGFAFFLTRGRILNSTGLT